MSIPPESLCRTLEGPLGAPEALHLGFTQPSGGREERGRKKGVEVVVAGTPRRPPHTLGPVSTLRTLGSEPRPEAKLPAGPMEAARSRGRTCEGGPLRPRGGCQRAEE